jgi:hypothetical protein
MRDVTVVCGHPGTQGHEHDPLTTPRLTALCAALATLVLSAADATAAPAGLGAGACGPTVLGQRCLELSA